MSSSAVAAAPSLASLFLERLLQTLLPYLTGLTPDADAARAEALETLASYGARTRGELMNAVQVIILGFATLDTLCETTTNQALSPSMRLRLRGCANTLSRNGQKIEQMLLRRLARDIPIPTDLTQQPAADLTLAQVADGLAHTQAQIDAQAAIVAKTASRDRPTSAKPAANPQAAQPAQPQPQPAQPTLQPTSALRHPQPHPAPLSQAEQNKRLWGSAMMDTLAQMGMPVQPTPTT